VGAGSAESYSRFSARIKTATPNKVGGKMVASKRLASLLMLASVLTGRAEAVDQPVRSLLEMRQQNMVMQEWDLSCGAAALATLLRYQHGEDITEKETALALMNRTEYIENPQLVQIREGFSLLDLKRYVDSKGYRGNGFGRLQLKDLVARAPIIVPIKTLGYNHFVVFRGVLGNRVLMADSAWGNRTMLVDDFMQSWIDYPQLGRVGFVVQRANGLAPPNLLAPRELEFVMLR
jgi:predicted double-glycine peptidase